ncbi:MAG: hypothetical protein PQJ46_11085 [Spirochaetales bacterium]|nr:hypothetical protein [Spirochaetales bacterium]
MFGILVCENPITKAPVILKAFSGQFNGLWNAPGWAPPLINVDNFKKAVEKVDPELKELTAKIKKNPDNSQKNKLIEYRRTISQAHMREIHEMYNIRNFNKETTNLFNLFHHKKGIPAGTGDCCAPKLLNQAIILGLKPLSLAEFFWGRENRSGTKQHKIFYPPCEEKCRPILGFMLCGADK